MGGHIFSQKRIGWDEYNKLAEDVTRVIRNQWGFSCAVPRSFILKEDFGDLDVCIRADMRRDALFNETIKLSFDIEDKDISWNTSVCSINCKGFQVDLCFFPVEDYQSAVNYMSFGDTSNMVGVLFNKAFGMRFTHKGVVLPVKLKQEDSLGEVLISRNMRDILEFADLDYANWEAGFSKDTEVFNWISASKYFNHEFFLFENLNHQNKTRNRKRAMYSKFVKWIEACEFKTGYQPESSTNHLWRAALHFGTDDWITKAVGLVHQRDRAEQAARIFNGSNVKEITGLEGAELGRVLNDFKSAIVSKPGEWVDFLLFSGKDHVEKEFKRFYASRNA
jgi:hypothetical protein